MKQEEPIKNFLTLEMIEKIVKETPNDIELGIKIRKLIKNKI